MANAKLTQQVKEHAREQGAVLAGVTGADRLAEAPKGHRPQDFLEGAKSVVVVGLPVLRSFVDGYGKWLSNSEMVPETVTEAEVAPNEILSGPKKTMATYWPRTAINNHIYRRCTYEFLNMELQRLSFRVAMFLETAGFDTIYMPTTYGSTFSWKIGFPVPNAMGPFCHRHAAVAAGLGQFGLNNLVLTPQFGPLARFVSIITAAELEPDPLCEEQLCLGEECSRCKDECPNEAFTDKTREYDYGGTHVREWVMDVPRCADYKRPDRVPCTRQCWSTCPVGLKKKRPPAESH